MKLLTINLLISVANDRKTFLIRRKFYNANRNERKHFSKNANHLVRCCVFSSKILKCIFTMMCNSTVRSIIRTRTRKLPSGLERDSAPWRKQTVRRTSKSLAGLNIGRYLPRNNRCNLIIDLPKSVLRNSDLNRFCPR